MKYIRTKDGYIGKVENTKVYIKGEWFSIYDIKCFFEREADTIEELCDEFVVEFYDENDILRHKFVLENRIHIEQEKYFLDGGNVYGAIWTEWGLKYVAKLNDKGELELI